MGQFDYPDFTKKGAVSIFLSKIPYGQFEEGYFDENYGGEDDEEFNVFSYELGIGYYDHDFVEANGSVEGAHAVPIQQILAPCSFSGDWLKNALKSANEKEILEGYWAVLFFDLAFDPTKTKRLYEEKWSFLGVFGYDPQSV